MKAESTVGGVDAELTSEPTAAPGALLIRLGCDSLRGSVAAERGGVGGGLLSVLKMDWPHSAPSYRAREAFGNIRGVRARGRAPQALGAAGSVCPAGDGQVAGSSSDQAARRAALERGHHGDQLEALFAAVLVWSGQASQRWRREEVA